MQVAAFKLCGLILNCLGYSIDASPVLYYMLNFEVSALFVIQGELIHSDFFSQEAMAKLEVENHEPA